MLMTGILPINKPVGVRSTYCVEVVRHICGRHVKVGHGGTLDSTASGVLLLLLGQATRLSDFVVSMPKRYEVDVQLGSETSTDDASGDIISEKEWRNIDEEAADEAAISFLGWKMQVPPQISAVHVDGERAHRISRSGLCADIKAKPVYFQRVKRTSPISGDGILSFVVDCHRGTYIRSFARDIGRLLNSAAHVSKLHRKYVGFFTDDSCVGYDEAVAMSASDIQAALLPVSSLSPVVSSYSAEENDIKLLKNGLALPLQNLIRRNFAAYPSGNDKVAVVTDKLFSICALERGAGSFAAAPKVNVSSGELVE